MRPLPLANPRSRFSPFAVDYDAGEVPNAQFEVFEDHTKNILSKNDSPDVGFRWSINPYRGCLHGCAYCYARPSHEHLSLGAGTDFERKIVIKRQAAQLLQSAFEQKNWQGECIVFSGVTDCYQPLETKLRLTRGCLDVCASYKNPVGIITKSPVIERDIDVLARLHETASVRVTVSVPFWNAGVARALEPNVTTPERRIRMIETLAKAGIPVGVGLAPIIPGLNDEDLGHILEAAAKAGASHAFYVLLRLPGPVAQVFEQTLREKLPLRAGKVLRRIRETRGGRLYNAAPGRRFTGHGVYADTIATLFKNLSRRHGLDASEAAAFQTASTFARPRQPPARGPQLGLGF